MKIFQGDELPQPKSMLLVSVLTVHVHSFIHLFIYLFVYLFIYLFIYLFNNSSSTVHVLCKHKNIVNNFYTEARLQYAQDPSR